MFLGSVDWAEVHKEGMAYDNFPIVSSLNGLEQCPWCGQEYHEYPNPVITGDDEVYENYLDTEPGSKIYHLQCKKKREMVRHKQEETSLADFQ